MSEMKYCYYWGGNGRREGGGEGSAGPVLRGGRGGLCRPCVEKGEGRALSAPC